MKKTVKRAARSGGEEEKPVLFALFEGESIAFHKGDEATPASDEELNRRYVKGEVRIVTESARYSLAGILSMLQEKVVPEGSSEPELRYKLDPEYQRRHRWDNGRKSRLIESFLMNIPVPPVFLYERDLARFEVMDGRQRLPELDGRYYKDLPTKVRDGIDRRYISSIVLLKETGSGPTAAAKLTKTVFERLNSGGARPSHQETRNAVYEGPLNRLCLDLSKNKTFREMWGIPNELPINKTDDDDTEDEETDPEKTKDETATGEEMFKKMEIDSSLRATDSREQYSSSIASSSRIRSHFFTTYLKSRRSAAYHAMASLREGPQKSSMIQRCTWRAVKEGAVDRWGTIQELQVDDNPVESVEESNVTREVGVRVDVPLKGNMKLFVLEAKDDLVWG